MREFDFSKEMVSGKKHMKKLDYNLNNYKFIQLVSDLFECELNNLHNQANTKYEIFTTIGKDSDTEFHRKFYNNSQRLFF